MLLAFLNRNGWSLFSSFVIHFFSMALLNMLLLNISFHYGENEYSFFPPPVTQQLLFNGKGWHVSYANVALNEVIFKCTESFPVQRFALILNLFAQTAPSWHGPGADCVSSPFLN